MQVFFPSELRAETLPDMPELMSVVDGPIVLAGITGSDCGITGADKLNEQFMPQMEHTYGTFPWRQNSWAHAQSAAVRDVQTAVRGH